ncbi:hypothetical protein I317_02944 [Kwoniella heveanensis CBS 569]|nr:hypothetical protein I317_02944 [Kwoniella heveanensis CBS 569]
MPELIERPCEYAGCDALVLRQGAICTHCFEVRCDEHKGKGVHPCRSWGSFLEDLWEKLRGHQEAIYEEIRRLRPGHQCEIEIPQPGSAAEVLKSLSTHMIGGFNVNFVITFRDGVKWVLRVRQDEGHRLPRSIRDASIRSEVTTLNLLKANGIAVAAAWLPSHLENWDSTSPEPPFDYFFTEFLEGRKWSMRRLEWNGPLIVDNHDLEDFIDAYAQQQIKLSEVNIPSKQIGCLTTTPDGEIVAGPIITRGAFMSPKPPYFFGPFSNLQDRYLTQIRAALQYAAVGAISVFEEPIDVYLWHLELEELVKTCKFLSEEPDTVFIKHDDDKADVYLFNEHDQVVGVLDWEWAFTTTKGEAFAAPEFFYDKHDYMRDLNEMTHEENLLIAAYEKHGRSDLAECVRNGRIFQRLSRIGRYTFNYWKDGFRKVFGEIPLPDFDPPKGREDDRWRLYMMQRYKDHEGLKAAMKRFGWTLARAEEEIPKGDERKKELEVRRAKMEEEEKEKMERWIKKQEEKAKLEAEKAGTNRSSD